MTLFREHRGGLEASMATTQTVADREALVAKLAADLKPYGLEVRPDMVTVEPYGRDERIGWDTHIVQLTGYGVVGYTDGPI